eukprot:807271_1
MVVNGNPCTRYNGGGATAYVLDERIIIYGHKHSSYVASVHDNASGFGMDPLPSKQPLGTVINWDNLAEKWHQKLFGFNAYALCGDWIVSFWKNERLKQSFRARFDYLRLRFTFIHITKEWDI